MSQLVTAPIAPDRNALYATNSGGMLNTPKKESTPDAATKRLSFSKRIWINSRERGLMEGPLWQFHGSNH